MKKKIIYLVVLLLMLTLATANGIVDQAQTLKEQAGKMILWASVLVTVLIGFAIYKQKSLNNFHKKVVFAAIVTPIVVATLFSAGSTIYLNTISETQGPVHWHADFEIWNCGENVDLLDPTGLMNRIGTPVLHEHNDFRVHVEGVLIKKEDASLGKFFEIIGGKITNDEIEIPSNQGKIKRKNGDLCNRKEAELQVFVLKIDNPDEKPWTHSQKKIDNIPNYVMAPYSYVPQGDCIIIEFDEPKEKTDKMCETYKVAQRKGDLIGS